jgi:hypothetical protein
LRERTQEEARFPFQSALTVASAAAAATQTATNAKVSSAAMLAESIPELLEKI